MAKKVLVITDAQNEFITGALGNKECEAAVKNIVAVAESGEYYKVIITKDTHTADYLDTQEGKRLPILHGQEGTAGYEIHPDIVKAAPISAGKWFVIRKIYYFCNYLCIMITRYEPIR